MDWAKLLCPWDFSGKNSRWVPFPSSRVLAYPEIKPSSESPALQANYLSLSHQGSLINNNCCCWSVAWSCPTLCDPVDCSMPVCPTPSPEVCQVHVHCIGDAIQPSHPLMPSSPSALNLSQHQGLFQWISYLHQMTKILELQLQHQSFQ